MKFFVGEMGRTPKIQYLGMHRPTLALKKQDHRRRIFHFPALEGEETRGKSMRLKFFYVLRKGFSSL